MIIRVHGDLNPADVLTKPLEHEEMNNKLNVYGAVTVRGKLN